MAAHWTDNDTEMVLNNLVDGLPVQQMMALFPNRSEGAIKLKAQGFAFGVKTSNEDGVIRFYANIKSRVRHANTLTDIDENNSINAIKVVQPSVTVPSNSILEEACIVTYDGLSANTLVVRMLTEYNIDIDPDIVYVISKHILKGYL
jgi:hypothetical protein